MIVIPFEFIEDVDAWLDSKCGPLYLKQPLAQDWARVSKVSEELGEAIAQLIIFTGQNPRKSEDGNAYPMLLAELADVVLTGILAMQHFTKDVVETQAYINACVRKIQSRLPSDPSDTIG